MNRFALTSVLGSLLILSVHAESESCDSPQDVCPAKFMDDFKTMSTMLPTVDYLERNCEDVLQTFDCLLSHNESCGSSMFRQSHTGKLVDASRRTVESVCDEKTILGKGYRENVDCVNGSKEEFIIELMRLNDVMTSYTKFLISEKPDFDNEKESSNIFCLGFSLLMADLAKMAESSCGEDAKDTVARFAGSVMDGCPSDEEMSPYEELYLRFIKRP